MRVKLKDLVELEQKLKKLAPTMEKGLRAIALKGAQFGATRGVTHSRRAGIRASGTYEQSFVAHATEAGAVVGNTAEHAVFVEVGRRPGRRPPLDAILKWLILKGLISLKLPAMSDREARRQISASGKGVTGNVYGGKQRQRLRAIAKRRVERYKRAVRKKHVMAAMGMAFAVQKKIGARGTTGKRIMRKVHRDVARYVKRELRKMAAMLR